MPFGVIVGHGPDILHVHPTTTLPDKIFKALCFRVCPSVSLRVSESVPPEELVNTLSPTKRNFAQFWSRVYFLS